MADLMKIARILAKRDDMELDEALIYVKEVADEISEALAEGAGVSHIEEIIADELGLEPDYIFDLLDM